MNTIKYIIPIICSAVLFASCEENTIYETVQAKVLTPEVNGEILCPYLTTDNEGTPVLSWVKKTPDGNSMFCFSIAEGSGMDFIKEIEVLPSRGIYPHGENLPKILFKPNGEIIAAWGVSNPNPNNRYSGLIYYSSSSDKGITWTEATPLVTDTLSYDQRYFDFTVLENGEAGMIWLDNRKDSAQKGMTMYFAETENGNKFLNERVIATPCCECCRTNIYRNGSDNLHIAYRAIINDSIRDMMYMYSADNGKSFSTSKRISADNWVIDGCPHTGPSMTASGDELHFTWFTAASDEAAVYTNNTANHGQSFSSRELVSNTARHPQLTALQDGALITVWEEGVKSDSLFYTKIVLEKKGIDNQVTRQDLTPPGISAEFPVVVPAGKNRVCVAWTQYDQPTPEATSGGHHHRQQHSGNRVYYKDVYLAQ